MNWNAFWRFVPCALVLVALLGCSPGKVRDKYSNVSPEQAARDYLALSESDRRKVDRYLTDDERRRLQDAIARLQQPSPEPTQEPEPVATATENPAPAAPPPAAEPTGTAAPPVTPPAETHQPVVDPAPVEPPAPPAPVATPAPPEPDGPLGFTPALPPQEFLDRLFNGQGDPYSRLFLPGYTYFQGAVGSAADIVITGPVRVIGGLTGGTGKLGKGAMVTTNPDYMDSVTPGRNRFRIVEWKEVD